MLAIIVVGLVATVLFWRSSNDLYRLCALVCVIIGVVVLAVFQPGGPAIEPILQPSVEISEPADDFSNLDHTPRDALGNGPDSTEPDCQDFGCASGLLKESDL